MNKGREGFGMVMCDTKEKEGRREQNSQRRKIKKGGSVNCMIRNIKMFCKKGTV